MTAHAQETIFALATPPGKSGVAVLRVSGVLAKESVRALGVVLPAPRVASLANLTSSAGLIDKGLIFYFPAPASFTGEDVVEFHTHGSRAVIKQLLDLLGGIQGFRPAEAGEFTRRAFLNNKMDLTAAEGLADLIDAETEAQRKQALRIMQGDSARFYEQLRTGVLHTLAYLEAYIDFPDEDIPEHVLAEVETELSKVTQLIEAQLADGSAAEKIRDGVFVTIVGPPNVGKSSLMNVLAGRDVAIVSHIAGTTRDVIEVQLDIGGYNVLLSDTAGIREHAGEIEAEGIRRSFERAAEADITLVMLDKDSKINTEIEGLITADTLVLMNKSDLGLPSPLPQVAGLMPIPVSAQTRDGLDKLMAALKNRIELTCPPEASFITRARHRVHLSRALGHLQQYQASSHKGLELRCEELRRAAVEIGTITGKISVDELLGHIFSSFCIGK